jgi:antitoxin component YwqK of YwqJK toxin-antitoxin module
MTSRIRFLLVCAAACAVSAALLWYRGRKSDSLTGAPLQVARQFLTLQDGRLHRQGWRSPFTGIMVEFHPDGRLLSRSEVFEGRLNGVSEGWLQDGTLQVREHFRSGVSHGTRTKWHPNGAKLSEATVVCGKIEGTFRQWHENGTLSQEISMKAGQPDGMARAFYTDGTLKAQAVMNDGRLMEPKSWPDGQAQVASGQPPGSK